MFSVFELAKMLPIQIINTELYKRVLRGVDEKNHQNPQNPRSLRFLLIVKEIQKYFFAVRTSQNYPSKIKQFETIL